MADLERRGPGDGTPDVCVPTPAPLAATIDPRSILGHLAGAGLFTLQHQRHGVAGDGVLLNLSSRPLGDGVTPLVADLSRCFPDRELALAVDDPLGFQQRHGEFLQARAPRARIVASRSDDHRATLARSSLVFLTDPPQLGAERIVDRCPDRVYVRLYHGLITKAYGRLRPTAGSVPARVLRGLKNKMSTVRVDVHCVSSRVEAFFRAAAEGGDPRRYHVTNDPRYPRALHLDRNPEDTWLPAAVRSELEDCAGRFRVLYAPTHKDHVRATTALPFEDLDPPALRRQLSEAGIVLFLRFHPREEVRGVTSELVDGEVIRTLTTSAAPSLTEALPFLDAAVTDYSSIYMDFVLLDRPVVFVRDAWEEFVSHRGIAFDQDDYFPGPLVSSAEDLLRVLSDLRAGQDVHRAQRAFVRRALLPEPNVPFLEQLGRVPGCEHVLTGIGGP